MRLLHTVTAISFAGLITISASPASAATFQISQQTNLVFGSNGYVGVKIYDDDLRPSGINTLAGGFAVQGNINGTGIEKFTAWCLDISTYLRLPSLYSKTISPFTNALLSATQKANIQKLFNTALATLNLSDNDQSGAFQLALWELVNEDDGSFNVSSGSFKATGALGARTLANTLLLNLGNAASDSYGLTFLKSKDHYSQNLVTAELEPALETIPLPAAGFLLLGALGGLGLVARAKRSL